ncbi:uncharacterized protein ACBR49_010523 [Aulostomus maculatus]
MAPTQSQIEWQTSRIISHLFANEDDDDVECRQLQGGLEVDGPESDDDGFDAVLIAEKLKNVADSLIVDPRFKAALTDMKRAVAQEAAEAAFSKSVDVLFQNQVSQGAEVAPEIQLIEVSVAFALYIKKSSPELINRAQSAMTAFLNRRVGPWLAQQGGWGKVSGIVRQAAPSQG